MNNKVILCICVLGGILCLMGALMKTEASEVDVSEQLASRLYGGMSDAQCHSTTVNCKTTDHCNTYKTETSCGGKKYNINRYTEKYCNKNNNLNNNCALSTPVYCVKQYECTWNDEDRTCDNGTSKFDVFVNTNCTTNPNPP